MVSLPPLKTEIRVDFSETDKWKAQKCQLDNSLEVHRSGCAQGSGKNRSMARTGKAGYVRVAEVFE